MQPTGTDNWDGGPLGGAGLCENLTDLQLLHELEPVVEKNLNRHLSMRKDWNPHDYIPWSDGKNYYALGGQDWDPEQSKLSEVAQMAMLQNLLTEDNLPSYHREIAMNFGMDGAWGQWVNRWTAEENRHGIALRDYLVVTRAIDPVELEKLRVEQVTRGFSPGQNQQGDLFAESLFDSVIYVTFQELATRVSHRNTGKACNETIADQLLQRVSADENLHMIFYRDVTEAGFDIAPNQAMQSLHRVLRNFKMPGYTVPEFRRKAVIIAVGGVYDPRIHLDDVVMPVLKKWRIFEREDFTGEAARMRDDLGVLVEELEETCEKFEVAKQRRLEREAQGRREEGRQEAPGGVISVLAETAAMSRLREEQTALRIGPIALRSPVVLAPMAGVTNVAFRTLCRELELARAGTVSGLYVCEMVTARALVERHPVTMHMTTFAPDESPRSLQLYTVDPDNTYAAAKMIADEGLADHIDMNFGCPVPKVTRRGGGAALPFKRRLFGQIVAAAVRATEGTDIPVTVKFRIGIDDAHHTHLDAGRIAAEEGAAAVALHARTAAQRYSGTADWEQIAAAQAARHRRSGARQRRHLRRR